MLHPAVRFENDTHSGGKKEIERLGRHSTMGRIRLEEINSMFDVTKLENIERDESILEDALKSNAIVLTADGGMKGAAQAKGLFVMEL